MTRLAPLAPQDELQEIDAALARAAGCPKMHPRVQEILRGRRADVEALLLAAKKSRSHGR